MPAPLVQASRPTASPRRETEGGQGQPGWTPGILPARRVGALDLADIVVPVD